jgi:hypothetical protein
MTARLTDSRLSTLPLAWSSAEKAASTPSSPELSMTLVGTLLVVVIRVPAVLTAASSLAFMAGTWPAVRRAVDSGTAQDTCIGPVGTLVCSSGSSAGLMKAAPIQYLVSPGGGVVSSSGVATMESVVQNAESGSAGRMMPVTTRKMPDP